MFKTVTNKEFDNFTEDQLIDWILNVMTVQDYNNMITEHTTGDKLEFIKSINTNPLDNPICIKRNMRKDLICSKCFSIRRLKFRKNNNPKLSRNTRILTSAIIPDRAVPFLNALFFRIESFGDLQNDIQAINYINLILKNCLTQFAWFTKNPIFIKKALEKGYKKPDNVQIIFSVCKINNICTAAAIKRVFPFIDKIFIVCTGEYIDLNNITVNCGGSHCYNCLNCFTPGGNEVVIEKVK